MEFAKFWIYLGSVTLCSYFPLWEWECLSYVQPVIVFWKHIWFYRFTAGEEFCLRVSHISGFTHR